MLTTAHELYKRGSQRANRLIYHIGALLAREHLAVGDVDTAQKLLHSIAGEPAVVALPCPALPWPCPVRPLWPCPVMTLPSPALPWLSWPCPALAFMALPCHDAAMRCPALPCSVVSWLCTHRSGPEKVWYLYCMCAFFWCVHDAREGAAVPCRSGCCHPLPHAIMCLHCGGCMHG